MKNKNYCGRKIVETGKMETSGTQIHDCSLFFLGRGTSIKSYGLN